MRGRQKRSGSHDGAQRGPIRTKSYTESGDATRYLADVNDADQGARPEMPVLIAAEKPSEKLGTDGASRRAVRYASVAADLSSLLFSISARTSQRR